MKNKINQQTKNMIKFIYENLSFENEINFKNEVGIYFKNLVSNKDYFIKVNKNDYEYYFNVFNIFEKLFVDKELSKKIFGYSENDSKEVIENNKKMLEYLENLQNSEKELKYSPLRLEIAFGNNNFYIALVINNEEITLKLKIYNDIKYIDVSSDEEIKNLWKELIKNLVTYL